MQNVCQTKDHLLERGSAVERALQRYAEWHRQPGPHSVLPFGRGGGVCLMVLKSTTVQPREQHFMEILVMQNP